MHQEGQHHTSHSALPLVTPRYCRRLFSLITHCNSGCKRRIASATRQWRPKSAQYDSLSRAVQCANGQLIVDININAQHCFTSTSCAREKLFKQHWGTIEGAIAAFRRCTLYNGTLCSCRHSDNLCLKARVVQRYSCRRTVRKAQ